MRPFLSAIIALAAFPFAALVSVVLFPNLSEQVSPTYSLIAPPPVERNGQRIGVMLPVEKHHTCIAADTPYAVFKYVDSGGAPRSVAFELRGLDEKPLSPQELMADGEIAVLGPYLITASEEALTYASEFSVVLPCRRTLIGIIHPTLDGFSIPITKDHTATSMKDDLYDAGRISARRD